MLKDSSASRCPSARLTARSRALPTVVRMQPKCQHSACSRILEANSGAAALEVQLARPFRPNRATGDVVVAVGEPNAPELELRVRHDRRTVAMHLPGVSLESAPFRVPHAFDFV